METAATARRADRRAWGTTLKREAILSAATQILVREGYGATSMDAVARRAGVAKQTVYSHFGSKAGLFEAIVAANAEHMLEPLIPNEGASLEPAPALETMARRLLDVILSPEGLGRFRLVVAESGRFPELAEVFFHAGPERLTAGLAGYLSSLHADHVLDIPDARLAATQFFGMVRGDVFLRALLRIGEAPPPREIDRIVGAAVHTFLKAYRRD